MVTLEFQTGPDASDVEDFLERIQSTETFPRGLTAGRIFEYDESSKTLTIDFEQLKRALIEHQMFEQARGFSMTELDILRVIESGPDRMRFAEIRSEMSTVHEKTGQDPLADQTLQHYLRRLREKELVEHEHNSYTYIGP